MRKFQVIITIIALLLFLCGLVIVFTSPSIGLNAVNDFVRNRGGSIESSLYEVMLISIVNSYRVGGMAMAIVGGIGTVLYSLLIFRID